MTSYKLRMMNFAKVETLAKFFYSFHCSLLFFSYLCAIK